MENMHANKIFSKEGMEIRGNFYSRLWDGVGGHLKPEARVAPTPFRLVRVAMACSTLGSFRKALRLSVWTALGVLMRTRFVN